MGNYRNNKIDSQAQPDLHDWEDVEKPATNPLTGQPVLARRRQVKRDFELPMKDVYSEFLRRFVEESK